jgi:cysteine synthase
VVTVATVHNSIVEATQLPHLVRLKRNLYAAVFDLMKLLPARYIIAEAERRGVLDRHTTVIETSSGTFGLSLAMVCRLRGHPLVIIGDRGIDDSLRRGMRRLGAHVEIIERPHPEGGYQRARSDMVDRMRERYPKHFLPGQYDNPDHPKAYEAVADHVTAAIGPIDCLVGTVGSGASTGGMAAFLRAASPALQLVGVDTHGSVLFGQHDRPRLLGGLGNSVHVPNVSHNAYDEVHWVTAAEAFAATRRLHAEHCLHMGPTSGAAYLVADWWTDRNPDRLAVAILPDNGHRYQSTVYSDGWLAEHDALPQRPPTAPALVGHPLEVVGRWSRLWWGRRELGAFVEDPHDGRSAAGSASAW